MVDQVDKMYESSVELVKLEPWYKAWFDHLIVSFFPARRNIFVEKKDKGYNRINKTESEMTKTLTVL